MSQSFIVHIKGGSSVTVEQAMEVARRVREALNEGKAPIVTSPKDIEIKIVRIKSPKSSRISKFCKK